MDKVFKIAKQFLQAEDGQDLVEYALMAASVAVVAGIFFPPTVMPAVSGIFEKLVSIFQQAP